MAGGKESDDDDSDKILAKDSKRTNNESSNIFNMGWFRTVAIYKSFSGMDVSG